MQKNLTLTQYRMADVTILSALCCVFEVIVTVAATKWFPEQPYSVSIVYAFFALVAMRWNGYAAITAFSGGLAHCIAAGDITKGYVVVCIGNLCCLFALFMHKIVGKQKIRDGAFLTVLYVAAVFVFVSAGRFALLLLFGSTPLAAVRTVLYDVLSFVFSTVIVLICRKQNGLFEDQVHYLQRTEEQRRKELSR